MPIYEFRCPVCKKEFQELILRKHSDIFCPRCHSPKVKKLLSAVSFKSGEDFTSSNDGSSCAGCPGKNCSNCH